MALLFEDLYNFSFNSKTGFLKMFIAVQVQVI